MISFFSLFFLISIVPNHNNRGNLKNNNAGESHKNHLLESGHFPSETHLKNHEFILESGDLVNLTVIRSYAVYLIAHVFIAVKNVICATSLLLVVFVMTQQLFAYNISRIFVQI